MNFHESAAVGSAAVAAVRTADHHHEQQLLAAEAVRQAVERCQIERVIDLLKNGAPSVLDAEGQTPLHLAAAAGHLSLVEALLQAGCDVSVQDFTGHTALQRAAAEGHIEIIKTLLENGVSVDHQDEVHGNTALHEAAWKGYSQSVQVLCKAKANAYIKNRGGFAALHLCCQNGHNETCRVLLLAGCKPDIKNNYGDTPLHTGARYGHAGVIRILVSAKCNPSEQNKNGDTALHIAAAMGRRKLTRVLLESNCSRTVRNKQNETCLDIAKRKNLVDIVQIIENPPNSRVVRNMQKQGFMMESYAPDGKDFEDESSEEEYDVDGIIPDPSYSNNNNSSSPMSMHNNNNNYHHHNNSKREKSSSSSRENHKRNKTHAAMVHHEDQRQQQQKVRSSSKHQQQQQQQQQQKQQPYYHDERSSRRKKKVSSKKKSYAHHGHHEASYDEDEAAGLFSSPVYRDELDSSFPPPRLSDFDEMFQRAASNRQRRSKPNLEPEDLLDMDPPLGKPGEQYYLDLAGNIRKGPATRVRNCYCAPVFSKFEKRLEKDKLELIHHIDKSQNILTSRITYLEKKTKEQLFGLNQVMKESFAQERGECLDRMDRRALRERIAIERQQVLRDMALKRELAVWLDSKLTQIEQKHNLDAKNAALLRALAIKRFSKFRRARQRMSMDDEFGPGTLRRAHSEELMSEVGISHENNSHNLYNNVDKKTKMSVVGKTPAEDDQSLQSLRVSDKPAGSGGRRVRHNSAESAAEMSRKFPLCPEYADFYAGQFEVDLMASRLAGSPLATSEPISENASSSKSSSGVFGLHRWQEDLSMTRVGELEVSNRPVYSHNGSQYSDDRSPETRLDLVVRDETPQDSYPRKNLEKYFSQQNYREDSLTPSNETESKPSSFILQETSSFCLSHGLPKPIPKFSVFGENNNNNNGPNLRSSEQNGYSNGHYPMPKYNAFENGYHEQQYSNHNGMDSEMVMVDRNRTPAELHRAQLAYIPGSSPSCASSSEPTSPAINSLRNFEAYRVNDVTKTNGNFEQYRVNDVTKAQRIYQNHSPKMSGQLDDNPPPLPARGGAPLPVTTNGGAPAPNHGVIPFFPFHQFPGRSVKPNLAPLNEDDYSQADDHSDFSANHLRNKSGTKTGHNDNPVTRSKTQNDLTRSRSNGKISSSNEGPLHLNLPLGSDGQGSHDSHNDSGYSTRLGFSAGPSPSLSGSRPASSEGEAPSFNGVGVPQTLLLDPLAINMMPPEFEKPVTKSFHLDPSQHRAAIETQKIHNGLRHLQLADTDINFNGFTSAMAKNNNYAPKGSLV